MLKASSWGLSIPFARIHIHRRGHTLPTRFLSSQYPRARCVSNVSLLLSNDTQTTEVQRHDGKGRQVVTNPSDTLGEEQHNVHFKRTLRALYAIMKPKFSHGIPVSTISDIHHFGAEPSGSGPIVLRDQTRMTYMVDLWVKNRIAPYHVGNSQFPAVKKLYWRKRFENPQGPFTERQSDNLLRVLESTQCSLTAWNAYTTLFHMIPDGHSSCNKPFIPFAHLHRLSRLLSRNKPQTHVQFLRLFSVLDAIRSSGGHIHVHEWNTLIDHAARGWRKARIEDWELALSLYNDMVHGCPPGTTLQSGVQASKESKKRKRHMVEPDIYTYCSLLNTAVNTRQSQAVRRAISLLYESKIPPNRIFLLTLLKHYATSRQMSGVRSIMLNMREQGFELGLDGVNACLWAYGWNGRPDIVTRIYRLLRHNVSPGEEETNDVVLTLRRQLEEEEYICISDDIRPDGTTFAVMIQVMAHHGDLLMTLSIFMDMLSILPSQLETSNDPNLLLMMTIFRAIFLGFSRNGIPPYQDGKQLPPHIRISNPPDRPHWSLKNLEVIFDAFLSLPGETRACRSTLHWIMNAFDVTSGQDEDVLREVWRKLDARFGANLGMYWVAPTNRLAAWRRRLFPELDKGD